MIAPPQLTAGPFARRAAAIAADALTRIPAAHFGDIAWATSAVATCAASFDRAREGDRFALFAWIRADAGTPARERRLAVLRAVCDAVVADAFRSHGDISAVTAFVASVERDVLHGLTFERQRKESDLMFDPETRELAAGLVRVVRMHDRETAVHLDATAALARRIAGAMQLPIEAVLTIELAARLHDIGKVGVHREVLQKCGPLTTREWSAMRLHTEIGAAALSDTPKLAFLAPIVRAHHERIDGQGYPDGLRGEEIPLESRVVAVADAFHAMTTGRWYRHAMMPNDALAILAENAGSQFDAEVVEATLALLHYGRRLRWAIA